MDKNVILLIFQKAIANKGQGHRFDLSRKYIFVIFGYACKSDSALEELSDLFAGAIHKPTPNF